MEKQKKGRKQTFEKKMAAMAAGGGAPGGKRANARLPPEVGRIVFVKNLPFKITPDEMYDIFGKFGAIRQIRLYVAPSLCTKSAPTVRSSFVCRGTNNKETRGTAFVVYEDIFDAKNAVDHLSGFNIGGRYLIVLYHQQARATKKMDQKKKKEEIDELKNKYGVE